VLPLILGITGIYHDREIPAGTKSVS
jgi:hypothetical protein